MHNAKKNIYLIRRFVALFFLILGLSIGLYIFVNAGTETLKAPKQEIVSNFTKFQIQPVQYKKGKELVFYVKIESTQNQASVQSDLLKTTLLVDEKDNIASPCSWKTKQEGDYVKEGYLSFPMYHKPHHIKLSYFELEEHIFEWQL